jgi:hypothetical protein
MVLRDCRLLGLRRWPTPDRGTIRWISGFTIVAVVAATGLATVGSAAFPSAVP